MKICIRPQNINIPLTLNGYTDITNMVMLQSDDTVANGEADEIVVFHMLNTYQVQELPQVIMVLMSKLKIGGTLILYYNDVVETCRLLLLNVMDIPTFNQIVFSQGQYKSMIGINDIKGIISNMPNMQIEKIQLQNVECCIEIKRIA
jgi:hypothetical protein